jgi:hypothetical protein
MMSDPRSDTIPFCLSFGVLLRNRSTFRIVFRRQNRKSHWK